MKDKTIPRLLIAAPVSGSGKTVITCGLLKAFTRRGLAVAGFKCGPDYIDRLFHQNVLGVEGGNLDGFFQTKKMMEDSFYSGCAAAGVQTEKDRADIALIEGVMGYFDGLGGITARASTWEIARWLDCPVILVVDGRGAGLSAAALIQGFLEFEPKEGQALFDSPDEKEFNTCHAQRWKYNGICGILLNRTSLGMYQMQKTILEERFSVPVVGYLPKFDWLKIESRHLGLKLPGEIKDLQRQLLQLAEEMEKTVDLDLLLQLAGWKAIQEARDSCQSGQREKKKKIQVKESGKGNDTKNRPIRGKFEDVSAVSIAVARDEAFCFYYRDNLTLLEEAGAKLEFFSPLAEDGLPEGCSGLLLGGGYPELYACRLSENTRLRKAVRQAALDGMPILGECGGFLYLLTSLEGEDGTVYPMAGVLSGSGYKTGRLGRFGYLSLWAYEDGLYLKKGETIRAHEFHYWDSDQCGARMGAVKPITGKRWNCMRQEGRVLSGFPHLYYPSCPVFVKRFVKQCKIYQEEKTKR